MITLEQAVRQLEWDADCKAQGYAPRSGLQNRYTPEGDHYELLGGYGRVEKHLELGWIAVQSVWNWAGDVYQYVKLPVYTAPRILRALTIKRRWAEEIANETKRYEVRDFRTTYRGPVIITLSGEKITYCVAEIIDVIPVTEVVYLLTGEELKFGKWAWQLGSPQRIEPMPCSGKLGLWKLQTMFTN